LDNLFLLAEQPEHLMAIAGCWRFAAPPEAAEVRATLQRLVDTFPRFQQRVPPSHSAIACWFVGSCRCVLLVVTMSDGGVQVRVTYGGFAYWEDVPALNVEDHIVRLPLVPT
jgi:hypothetical protein